MNKHMKNFFTVLMAFPAIVCIIVAGCFNFNLDRASWIALATAFASATSTIVLGVVVYLQTESHNKNQEESSRLFQEQEAKNREQDLLIRANPTVFLNSIQRFDIGTSPCITSIQEGTKNMLSDAKPTEETQIFPYYLSFDILFNNPANRMVDYITIKSATLSSEHGNIAGDDYNRYFMYHFEKYNKLDSNLKLEANGDSISLLQLFPTNFDENKFVIVKRAYNDRSAKWYLTIAYTLSNSVGVNIDFEAQVVFEVTNVYDVDLAIVLKTNTINTVVWQKSELYINKKN